MEQAKQFLEQFQQAATSAERQVVTDRYQVYLKTLADEDRQQVRAFMQTSLRPAIDETVNELDNLVEKAELALKGKIVYKGKEYIFGDWLTIADYCRLYNFKLSRVQNWIDRKIVPAQNVVIIHELNNLKLVKNESYQPV